MSDTPSESTGGETGSGGDGTDSGGGTGDTGGLRRLDRRWEGAFDDHQCPVCGHHTWVWRPREGVFCEECNLAATLRPTMGDAGFVATYSVAHLHDDYHHRAFPETEGETVPTATAKFRQVDGGYRRAWFETWAAVVGAAEGGDYTPAWEADEVAPVAE